MSTIREGVFKTLDEKTDLTAQELQLMLCKNHSDIGVMRKGSDATCYNCPGESSVKHSMRLWKTARGLAGGLNKHALVRRLNDELERKIKASEIIEEDILSLEKQIEKALLLPEPEQPQYRSNDILLSIFKWRYVEKWTYKKIAQELGRSTTRISHIEHKALRKLRRANLMDEHDKPIDVSLCLKWLANQV
jgi:hypothetical protein